MARISAASLSAIALALLAGCASCQPTEPDAIQFGRGLTAREVAPGVVGVGIAKPPPVRAACSVTIEVRDHTAAMWVESNAALGLPSCFCEWGQRPSPAAETEAGR